jgi:hypothetical protein
VVLDERAVAHAVAEALLDPEPAVVVPAARRTLLALAAERVRVLAPDGEVVGRRGAAQRGRRRAVVRRGGDERERGEERDQALSSGGFSPAFTIPYFSSW